MHTLDGVVKVASVLQGRAKGAIFSIGVRSFYRIVKDIVILFVNNITSIQSRPK